MDGVDTDGYSHWPGPLPGPLWTLHRSIVEWTQMVTHIDQVRYQAHFERPVQLDFLILDDVLRNWRSNDRQNSKRNLHILMGS